MFTNHDAIKMLVKTDATATKEEKEMMIHFLCGKTQAREDFSSKLESSAVMSFDDTAKILGYKNARSVYAAVRRGRLQGFYGGSGRQRASGVLTQSVRDAISFRNRI